MRATTSAPAISAVACATPDSELTNRQSGIPSARVVTYARSGSISSVATA